MLSRIIRYFEVKFLRKRLDSKYWSFLPTDYKAYQQTYDVDYNGIKKYYPDLNLEDYKKEEVHYNFLIHCFSQYSYHYTKPVLLEPDHGWCIDLETKKILKISSPIVDDPWGSVKLMPSTLRFLNPFKRVTKVEEIISIRYGWQNYYHFFTDTLGQINMIDELGIDKNTPIVLPAFVKKLKYFNQFTEISKLLSGRKLIFQEADQYIEAQKVFFLKETCLSLKSIDSILSSLNVPPIPNGPEKVFLKRNTSRKRSISNTDEIEAIASKYQYKIVDTDMLSLTEQIQLFSGTRYLIGIHGAGLTNIIFRQKHELDVLELFPLEEQPDHYKRICKLLGYGYNQLVGSNYSGKNFSFSIDPESFESSIKKMEKAL